jgi:hypothetical protein
MKSKLEIIGVAGATGNVGKQTSRDNSEVNIKGGIF